MHANKINAFKMKLPVVLMFVAYHCSALEIQQQGYQPQL